MSLLKSSKHFSFAGSQSFQKIWFLSQNVFPFVFYGLLQNSRGLKTGNRVKPYKNSRQHGFGTVRKLWLCCLTYQKPHDEALGENQLKGVKVRVFQLKFSPKRPVLSDVTAPDFISTMAYKPAENSAVNWNHGYKFGTIRSRVFQRVKSPKMSTRSHDLSSKRLFQFKRQLRGKLFFTGSYSV